MRFVPNFEFDPTEPHPTRRMPVGIGLGFREKRKIPHGKSMESDFAAAARTAALNDSVVSAAPFPAPPKSTMARVPVRSDSGFAAVWAKAKVEKRKERPNKRAQRTRRL